MRLDVHFNTTVLKDSVPTSQKTYSRYRYQYLNDARGHKLTKDTNALSAQTIGTLYVQLAVQYIQLLLDLQGYKQRQKLRGLER